jgi:hypothetical protein
MRTHKMFAAAVAAMLVTLGAAGAFAASQGDVQSPRGEVKASTSDVQSPRGQDSQAPATTDDAQSPRSAR